MIESNMITKPPIKFLQYRLWKNFGYPKTLPFSYTFMLTYACNSKCRTCFIWKIYKNKSELMNRELQTDEFEKLFKSIGRNAFWVSLGGGEPFLRRDIVKICQMLDEYCSPLATHILTNATLPKKITKSLKKILENCNLHNLKINLSLDAIGKKHDEIRGFTKNFEKFMLTYQNLKELQNEIPKFNIGINTVISKYNISYIYALYEFVRKLNPDTHILEICQKRNEYLNRKARIIPNIDEYNNLMKVLISRIRNDYLKNKPIIAQFTQALRVEYHKLSEITLKRDRLILPCYAGYASVQTSPWGDVWPCAVLPSSESFGNLRDVDFKFEKIWFSQKADKIRKILAKRNCYCQTASVWYLNMLCSPKICLNVMKNFLLK